jgi:hypothetical protein
MIIKPKIMKLSEKTIKIFENFSNINQSILIKSGNKVRTISVMKNILAEAEIEEEFPKDFAIYDLKQFLNGIDLHQDPELDFANDSYVLIKEGKLKAKYFFADPEVIVSPPEKNITLPTKDVCFQLEHSQLDKLKKAAAVYGLDDISAIGENGVIKLVARDKKNDTSNEYSIIVGETDKEFVFNFKVENLKIIPSFYDVVISSKLLAQFTNEKYNICYYIALEPDSTFE